MFFRTYQTSIDSLQNAVDAALSKVPSVPADELPALLSAQRAVFTAWQAERLREFAAFAQAHGVQASLAARSLV